MNSTVEASAPEGTQTRGRFGGALAYPGFRWFLFGLILLSLGFWNIEVAQRWLAQELTGSPLSVGFIGFMGSVPVLLFSLPGGVLADRIDRVKLIVGSRGLSAIFAVIIGVLVALRIIQLWHVGLAAFAFGTMAAMELPGRQALFPSLVPKEELMHAIAIYSGVWSSSTILGPAIAGWVIVQLGIEGCYFLTMALYLAAITAFWQLRRYVRNDTAGETGESPWTALVGGLRYIAASPTLLGLLLLSLVLSVFGMTVYQALLPSFAANVLQGDASVFGLLLTFSGIGSLSANILLAVKAHIEHKGRYIVTVVLVFGASVVVLSLSTSLAFAAPFVVLGGIMSAGFMTLSTTLIQSSVSEEMRGRVMSAYMLTWGMSAFGSLLMGFIGSTLSVPVAIAIGGALVMTLCAAILFKVPEIARLQ